ncbi:MAG: CRISPR-associated helicase Cas3' [Acidobacteria bacterium]|nr:CRISPR-associated helicase Cas3' [Acidobacteriota bacterium]
MIEVLAKSSGETLADHTISCLNAAKALLTSLPLPDEAMEPLESQVLLAIAFHDLGKAASGFQRVLRGEQKDWGGKRHEILSASLASSVPDIPQATLLAILTHHKAIPADGISASGYGCLPSEQIPWADEVNPIWSKMAQEWLENRDLFKQEWSKICTVLGRDDLSKSNLDLVPLALEPGWASRATGKNGQRKFISFAQRYQASLVRGLTVAADHLGSAHYVSPGIPNLNSFPVLKHHPRPFQMRVGETEGSAILRAPTGSGKTEAALLWAQRNQRPNGRLFYVLPYTASINAMYRRLGAGSSQEEPGIFGAQKVGLLHSRAAAALYDMMAANGDESSRLSRQENAIALTSLAREMWFPIRVCTPHQILRFMLRGKGWETMLAEFPNACFIFDEVHAYDPRVVGLTLATARVISQKGARSLFLSATLPEFLEKVISHALGKIPIIVPAKAEPRDREIIDRKRHVIEIRDGTLMENLDTIIQAVEPSSSTLVVCNHVRTAQDLFDRLEDRLGKGVVLLHSRFNQEDRNSIEMSLANSSLPKVLVATQAVEVSLNLDFYQAFLEPAPIDALVQRMGRVNRSGDRPPAKVVIFKDQVKRHHLYCTCSGRPHMPECRVQRSLEEFCRIQSPVSEGDLVDAANRVYSDGYQGEAKQAFEEGFHHPDISDFESCLLAGAHQDWVEEVIESADGAVEVLPSCLVSQHEAKRKQGLWIEANALLVPVRLFSIGRLKPKLDMSCDPWTINVPYSSVRGLQI